MLGRSFISVLMVAALGACEVATTSPSPEPSAAPTQTLGPTVAPTVCCPTVPTLPPTAAPTPTASPPPTAQPTGLAHSAGLIIDWQHHLDSGLGAIEWISDMAFANGRFVAVGASGYPGPRAWYSDDGLHWTAATVERGTWVSVDAVAAGGPGFVAVGSTFSEDADSYVGVVLVSGDGQDWERVDSPLFVGHVLNEIGAIGGTLVAFGGEGGAFVSLDGRTWQMAADPGAAEAADGLLDLAATDDMLWAFSRDGEGLRPAKQKIGVWRTADGLTWTRTAIVDGSQNAYATAAAGPFGLALNAYMQRHNSTRYRAWYSADGTTWQPALNAPVHARDMVADDAGFIAVGWYSTGQGCVETPEDDVAVTWTSVDGLAWRQMPEEGWNAKQIQAIVVTGRTALALGVDETLLTDDGVKSALVLTAELPPIARDEGQVPGPIADVPNPEGCG